ncbi:MAG: hypothetical protein NVSMB19_26060 [Vulcanimicrobiaceae bacterium]
MLDDREKADVLGRLRSVRGHVDGVIKMVDADTYCVDVVKQISAMRAALDRVARIEIRSHIERCVLAAGDAGDRKRAIDDLLDALNFNKELV